MPDSRWGFLAVLSALAAVSLTTACRPTPPAPAAAPTPSANTWAVVDGHEITRDDVDKAYRRTQTAGQTLSDEETLTAKLGLLDNLILQEILIARARTKNITVPDADLEAAFNDAKKNIGDDAFQKELTQRGLTPTDMREGLRRELLTRKVIDQEIASKTTVSDKEVTDFFGANRAQFNVAEESYHLAQIVVTPGRDAQVTNSNGDDATTPQAAAAKVQVLIERLKSGTSFRELAAGYSEDPESAPRGGDLGLVPMSRLKQAPPQLRNAVLGKEPGSVNVASNGGAHTLVLVVAHELAGQRDLSTPGVREGITETLRSRKDQLFRAAYLMAIRTNAKIVNYLANRLVSATGPMPGLLPATPGGK